MVGVKSKTRFDARKVKSAANRASFRNLGHAAAAIRLAARRGIRQRKKPSPPGTPPHTRKGRLKNAIKYAVDKGRQTAVIGPDVNVAGTSGSAHEFGGRYRREQYPRRPFMRPALEKVKDRLPAFWAGSVR